MRRARCCGPGRQCGGTALAVRGRFGDSIVRPVAQVEWWARPPFARHGLCAQTPFDLFHVEKDEVLMIKTAPDYKAGSIAANGYLYRVLTLASFGNNIVGSSHLGSMGEHQISHWIDMFAGAAHPGSTHGQQVGVATVALARLHRHLFSLDKPPQIKPTRNRGGRVRPALWREHRAHDVCRGPQEIFDVLMVLRASTAVWTRSGQSSKAECKAMMIDPDDLHAMLRSGGRPHTRPVSWGCRGMSGARP